MSAKNTLTTTAKPLPGTATLPTSATKSPTNPWLVASYVTIVALWGVSQIVYIPFVLHLLVMVTAILYAACHQSLVLLNNDDGDGSPTDESQHNSSSSNKSERETLKKSDAYQFPLLGSMSLFSLYLAFKFLDKDLVNLLIGVYFGAVGCLALTMTLAPVIIRVTPPWFEKDQYTVHLPFETILEFSMADVVSFVLSAILCGLYFALQRPWYLNNVIGIVFCLQGIERFSLGTYKIGAILLIGLFFYDIFWVFGTEVMVTVAKNLDGPIKILFPRESLQVNPDTGRLDLSLLGLGDIVIPGFFLSLLLRFDAHRAGLPRDGSAVVDTHTAFPKPYFIASLIAYILGLGTTLFVMAYFDAAQPALLYLVPACLGSSFTVAIIRGEVKELLEYSEEQEEVGDDVPEPNKNSSTPSTTKEPEAKKVD